MNPEFLREGKAVTDFMYPDRIVLGVTDDYTEQVMRKLYCGFENVDILITNPTTAEMIKYTANSFLALCISYSNEIARICEKINDVNSIDVFRGVILDKRISPIINGQRVFPELISYLRAGCGFGGSCFPKDVKALASFEKEYKVDSRLLEGLLYINETQIAHIFKLGIENFIGNPKTIAVLGTAFKDDTDDIRESPGIKIIEEALKRNFKVQVHDCIAIENTKQRFGNSVKYFESIVETIWNADIIYVTTIWDGYKKITDEQFEAALNKNSLLIDCRSIYNDRENKKWRIKVGYNN